ncbi:hypothetical protein DSL92_05210 [Billgrantia gudaonensis]|uniref:Aerobactin siderophore biosynthesis IucA/IucC-like C-terminal domain-containing protein n=1 Tax=Billgrantia gudaonensis TaxID=376427 RepID=A0A432JJ71_9GAMM|nr:hypothetical protein DSL92_05210 [Halomonas gudaonensis]
MAARRRAAVSLAGTEERFTALFDQHCEPLIEALAALSGLSPKVFWSNPATTWNTRANLLATSRFAGAGEPLLRYSIRASWRMAAQSALPAGTLSRPGR